MLARSWASGRGLYHADDRESFPVGEGNGDSFRLGVALEEIERHAGQGRSHLKFLETRLARGVLNGCENQSAESATCKIGMDEDGSYLGRIDRGVE